MKLRVTSKQYNAIVMAYRLGGFAFSVGILTLFSIMINRVIEFTTIFGYYFITKGLYSEQFHAKSLVDCLIKSICIFGLATFLTVSIEVSIMFSVVVGLAIALLSYEAAVLQFKLRDYSYIEPKYNELASFYQAAISK